MDTVSQFVSLGYTLPCGIAGGLIMCFVIYLKWQENKQDKDRSEHVKKWESMVGLQKDTVQRLIDTHEKEMDRQFKLHERSTSTLEALTHHLSILTKDLK